MNLANIDEKDRHKACLFRSVEISGIESLTFPAVNAGKAACGGH